MKSKRGESTSLRAAIGAPISKGLNDYMAEYMTGELASVALGNSPPAQAERWIKECARLEHERCGGGYRIVHKRPQE